MAPKVPKREEAPAPPATESDIDMEDVSPNEEKELDENSPHELAKKEQRIRVVWDEFVERVGGCANVRVL
jgi:hypothetical protein